MYTPSTQQATLVPKAAILVQASSLTSSAAFDYSHDIEEPNYKSESLDKLSLIDCVNPSEYQVRSNYKDCLKLNDRNFYNKVNSKLGKNTKKSDEIDENHRVEENEAKQSSTYTGSIYTKSPNDGYVNHLSRSASTLSSKSNSVANSGLEHHPSVPSNDISSRIGTGIAITDLNQHMGQIDDADSNFKNNDLRNSIVESRSAYSLNENQESFSTLSEESNLSSSNSIISDSSSQSSTQNIPTNLKFYISSLSSISQDTTHGSNLDSTSPKYDLSVFNELSDTNTESTDSLDQSFISDFDTEGEFPLPNSHSLPNLSYDEEQMDIFGSTQPNYNLGTIYTSNSRVGEMLSGSMPTFQNQSESMVEDTQSSENSDSVGSGQVQNPSIINETNSVTVPEDQKESAPSAEEMQLFEDEANDEDE